VLDDILQLRLDNQHLARPRLSDPTQLVAHFGAVQAQDYGAAKWALGQRLVDATAASLERAFTDGAILRTHVLRPTWHFVAPADIRWLLALTAPRVKASMRFTDRAIGLDDDVIARSQSVLVRAIKTSRQLTRTALAEALEQSGLPPSTTQITSHLLMHAELDGLVCSGPREGKQFTYALLDDRVPAAGSLDREAALAELTRRYFTSHGPATVRDCAWWSGLTVSDVKRGIDLNPARLVRETRGGLTYVFAPGPSTSGRATLGRAGFLLPNYDEYTVAYKDRDLFYAPSRRTTPDRREDVPFGNVMILDGKVAGTWKRELRNGTARIQTRWFAAPSEPERGAVAAAGERHGDFLGVSAEILS